MDNYKLLIGLALGCSPLEVPADRHDSERVESILEAECVQRDNGSYDCGNIGFKTKDGLFVHQRSGSSIDVYIEKEGGATDESVEITRDLTLTAITEINYWGESSDFFPEFRLREGKRPAETLGTTIIYVCTSEEFKGIIDQETDFDDGGYPISFMGNLIHPYSGAVMDGLMLISEQYLHNDDHSKEMKKNTFVHELAHNIGAGHGNVDDAKGHVMHPKGDEDNNSLEGLGFFMETLYK